MLTIRKEQIDALIAAQWRAFVPIACGHCRARHPEVCSELGEERLRSAVESGLRRARSHGFETASSLIRYLDFVLTVGPEFDQITWVAEVLSQTKFQPETRLDLVHQTFAELGSRSEEATSPAPSIPDVSWPAPPHQPVPPPPMLLPPDEGCMALPPPEFWSEP